MPQASSGRRDFSHYASLPISPRSPQAASSLNPHLLGFLGELRHSISSPFALSKIWLVGMGMLSFSSWIGLKIFQENQTLLSPRKFPGTFRHFSFFLLLSWFFVLLSHLPLLFMESLDFSVHFSLRLCLFICISPLLLLELLPAFYLSQLFL